MTFLDYVNQVSDLLCGWPLIIFVLSVAVICTVALGFIQIRHFGRSWRLALGKTEKAAEQQSADMTPFQAFINMLSTNLGNGAIAGMATAIYAGGPGAAFWVLVSGLILMSVRFSEVFLSVYFGARASEADKKSLGGPLLYLKEIFAGRQLAFAYAFFGLLFGCALENGMQANSIALSLQATWGVSLYASAIVLWLFMLYVVFGGAARIVYLSDRLVPLKVITFFGSAFFLLVYHAHKIIPALQLIVKSAFSMQAVTGGALGFTVQKAMELGMMRSIMASETGVGTAALFFGKTGSSQAVDNGIMSMLATFISTIVCFIVSLCIIVSGVWNSGLTSTELTVAAYNTVFGQYGGWIVSFLSISFGLGVAVSSAYFTQLFWSYFTGGRFLVLFALVYSACSFVGALSDVNLVWGIGGIVTVMMLVINLIGVLALLPIVRKEVQRFNSPL